MTQTVTARGQILRWIRERVRGVDEVSLPEVTDECLEVFRQDVDFLQRYFTETARQTIYEDIQRMAAGSRAGRGPLIPMGDEMVTRATLSERVERVLKRRQWEGFMEYVGGRNVNVMDMTREDLQAAAAIRLERATVNVHYARLWQRLSEGLAPGQIVRDRYTPNDIDRLYVEVAPDSSNFDPLGRNRGGSGRRAGSRGPSLTDRVNALLKR